MWYSKGLPSFTARWFGLRLYRDKKNSFSDNGSACISEDIDIIKRIAKNFIITSKEKIFLLPESIYIMLTFE